MAIVFDREDMAYLTWLDGHPHGYVVNAFRNLNPSYLMLHRASCGTITGVPTRGKTWTDGQYIKIGADTRQDIEQWARTSTNGALHPCGLCHPD